MKSRWAWLLACTQEQVWSWIVVGCMASRVFELWGPGFSSQLKIAQSKLKEKKTRVFWRCGFLGSLLFCNYKYGEVYTAHLAHTDSCHYSRGLLPICWCLADSTSGFCCGIATKFNSYNVVYKEEDFNGIPSLIIITSWKSAWKGHICALFRGGQYLYLLSRNIPRAASTRAKGGGGKHPQSHNWQN